MTHLDPQQVGNLATPGPLSRAQAQAIQYGHIVQDLARDWLRMRSDLAALARRLEEPALDRTTANAAGEIKAILGEENAPT